MSNPLASRLAFSLLALSAPALAPATASAQLPDATIYFTEGNGSTALNAASVSFSGGDLQPIHDTGTTIPGGMALDRERNHVYFPIQEPFGTSSRGAIVRVNTNGTGRQTVLSMPYPGPFPQGVTIDHVGQRLYWYTGSGTVRIWSCRLDGSDLTPLVAYNATLPIVTPAVMQVDGVGGKLYWYDRSSSRFRRCNLDGTQIEELLAPGGVYSADIDVENGFFYWTFFDQLFRAPIDGSLPPAVIATDPAVFSTNSGKSLDVLPSLDLITWVVSGGRIHWTPLSAPGAVQQLPTFQGVLPNGGLEVMPGPRVGLSVSPAVATAGGNVTFAVGGALPNGPAIVLVESWNGVLVNGLLFGAFTDAAGELSLTLPLPAALAGTSGTFRAFAFDPVPQIVRTLPAPLSVL